MCFCGRIFPSALSGGHEPYLGCHKTIKMYPEASIIASIGGKLDNAALAWPLGMHGTAFDGHGSSTVSRRFRNLPTSTVIPASSTPQMAVTPRRILHAERRHVRLEYRLQRAGFLSKGRSVSGRSAHSINRMHALVPTMLKYSTWAAGRSVPSPAPRIGGSMCAARCPTALSSSGGAFEPAEMLSQSSG